MRLKINMENFPGSPVFETSPSNAGACMHAKSLQSCLTLWDPKDCSPPGFSVHGILQVRILEWVAMPSSRDLPNPGIKSHLLCLLHWQLDSLPLVPPGKPRVQVVLVQPLVGKLRSHMACGQETKTQNRSNVVTNSIETFKMVHVKRNLFKKKL